MPSAISMAMRVSVTLNSPIKLRFPDGPARRYDPVKARMRANDKNCRKESVMKALIAAAAALLIPVAAAAQTPAPPPAAAPAADSVANIYGTTLGPGWQKWDWQNTTAELSVDVGSARKPIKVQPGPWGALYLHHDPFDTTPYRGISFLIQSVATPMKIQVIGLVGGKPVEGKSKVIDVAPGGWKRVTFALADIGAENVMLDGLWFQNFSAEPGPTFFITEIALKE